MKFLKFLLLFLFVFIIGIYFTKENSLPFIQKKAEEVFGIKINFDWILGTKESVTIKVPKPEVKIIEKVPKPEVKRTEVKEDDWDKRVDDLFTKKTSISKILEYIEDSKREEELLEEYFFSRLSELNPKECIESLNTIQVYTILKISKEHKWKVSENIVFFEWLLKTNCLKDFLGFSRKEDDLKEGLKIIKNLYSHDIAAATEYVKLIIAFALVWDQKIKLLHSDMGRFALPIDADIKRYYSYYKGLFSGDETSAIPYEKLAVEELIFVVDVPVPISELNWARKNKKRSYRRWLKYYIQVSYDKQRFRDKRFIWEGSEYNIKNIKKNGGLTIDQAYSAVITSRSYGIPVIFTTGFGSRGNHAWYSYKNHKGDWQVDENRFCFDKKADGYTYSPQTRQPMSTNDIKQLQRFLLKKEQLIEKHKNNFIAYGLRYINSSSAIFYAEKNIKDYPNDESSWEKLEKILLKKTSTTDEYINVMNRKMTHFGNINSTCYKSFYQLRELYQRHSKLKELEKLEDSSQYRKIRREHKYRYYEEFNKCEQFYLEGDKQRGQKEMESFLIKNMKNAGIEDFFIKYLDVTNEYKQQKSAMNFIRRRKATLGKKTKNSTTNLFLYLLELGIENYNISTTF